MYGSSAGTLFSNEISDYKSPIEYLDYIFDGVQGFVYRATINPYYEQTHHRVSEIWKQPFAEVENCFVSMNTFFRSANMEKDRGRDVEHLKRLNACFVDLDYYKQGLKQSEVMEKVHLLIEEGTIPQPSIIMNSGQGIYLIWKLRNEDKKALPRWQRVQNYFIDIMRDLGADKNCADAARVLRVPGSINGKCDREVGIIEFQDETYTLHQLIKDYNVPVIQKDKKKTGPVYPYGHATERQRKFVRDLAAKLGLNEQDYPNFESFEETADWIQTHAALAGVQRGHSYKKGQILYLAEFKAVRGWLGNVCADLRKLFSMRKGEDCCREIGLFMYRYFLREMKVSEEEALAKMLEFNASLDCPYDESFIIQATASADRRVKTGLPYRYSRKTIIEKLDVKPEELALLPCLGVSEANRKERKRESNKKAYQSRLAAEGKVAKQDAIQERRAAILALQEQGKTAAEIQNELQISKATYHRDIAAIKAQKVVEAVQLTIEDMVEDVANTVEKVTHAVQTAKKIGIRAAIRAAQKWVSQKFSPPIVERTALAVPQYIPRVGGYIEWQGILRSGDRAGEDPDGASPLSCPKK